MMFVSMFLPLLLLLEVIIPVISANGSVQVINYRKLRSTQNGPERCALDKANKTTSSSSLKDCSFNCGRDGTCTGFNIKDSLTCDVYNFKPRISASISACTFYEKIEQDSDIVNCLEYGDDATSIPAECCAVPYTLNGELYHNCTVNTAVNNDFGCYNNNGQWVTCLQPFDFLADYEETFTIALSANPAVVVPLLTINGWIVMHRKVTFDTEPFNQNWAAYRDGFGSATSNDYYWLGLDKVYRLIQLSSVTFRVEIQRTSGLWYWAEYSTFSISDETGNYQLTVDGYSGDAGDAMTAAIDPIVNSNGRMFSTPDRDNDVWATGNCATSCCGWWFGKCSMSCLTRYNSIWTTGTPVFDVQASRMLVRCN